MKISLQELITKKPIITDGAWGTQLQELGLKPGECPDLWNLTNSKVVENLARAYVGAGSQIILTNTFRANRLSLLSYNLEGKINEINQAGVLISRKAAGERTFVFASVGPIKKMLALEVISEDQMYEIFFEQAQMLARAGADGIAVESMADLAEAKIALRASKEMGLPVSVSMVFNSGIDKACTLLGNTPEQVAKELTSAGADVIGANCGLGIEEYIPICKRLRASTDKPLWIKPSAGLPELVNGRVIYKTSSRNFAMYGSVLHTLGADFIGGCCGTTPEYIHDLHRLFKGNDSEQEKH